MYKFNLSQIEVNQLSKLKNSVILVTGGTGFFGRWSLEFSLYLNNKYDFNIKLYLLSRSLPSEISSIIIERNDVVHIKEDIRHVNELPSDINYIIHAACSPDNVQHMLNPLDIMDIISNGTKRLFDLSLPLINLKKIINMSSGQVYGDIKKELITEKDYGAMNPNSIKSIYPESKRFSESLSKGYETLFKLPIVQVRPFSFIGPYMSLDKPWAINNFINDAIKFKKIRIIGNGKPIRSYMYPTDMITFLFNILTHDKNGVIYNLGNSEGISLEELAIKIKGMLGNEVSIDILNMNDDESIFIPDNTLINSEFKISHKVDINDAISNTIKWNLK